MSSLWDKLYGEVHVLGQCIECKKTRKKAVFPEAKAWNIMQCCPTIGYTYECPKCGTATKLYDTQDEARDAWNKHLTTKPVKKKRSEKK